MLALRRCGGTVSVVGGPHRVKHHHPQMYAAELRVCPHRLGIHYEYDYDKDYRSFSTRVSSGLTTPSLYEFLTRITFTSVHSYY
jgi:hypothetical protein